MKYEQLQHPKEIEVSSKTFAVSKIPAMEAMPIYEQICEIYSKRGVLGLSALPIEITKVLLHYVCVMENGEWEELDTEKRINMFFQDHTTLIKVRMAILKENFGFLTDGSLLDLLGVQAEAEAESDS